MPSPIAAGTGTPLRVIVNYVAPIAPGAPMTGKAAAYELPRRAPFKDVYAATDRHSGRNALNSKYFYRGNLVYEIPDTIKRSYANMKTPDLPILDVLKEASQPPGVNPLTDLVNELAAEIALYVVRNEDERAFRDEVFKNTGARVCQTCSNLH